MSVSATSIGNSEATLSVTVSGGTASKYIWSDGEESDTNSRSLTALTANKVYTYSVKAVDASGKTLGSGTITFTTEA